MDHLLRPAAGEPEGALVLLHGRGTSEHDLYGLLDVLDPQRRLLGVTPGGPLALPPGGRHWYVVPRVGHPDPDTFHASRGLLGEFLDALPVGPERTIVGGFSQGAVMSFALGLGPGRPSPAGVLALSGFIPTVPDWDLDLERHGDVPVLLAHGSLDPVIGIEFAHAARERLSAAGLPLDYHESAMAHTIDPRAIPAIAAWVAARTGV